MLLSTFEDWFLALILACVLIGVCVLSAGCADAVKRPDTNALVVNAPKGRLEGYNVLRDYDSNGNRLESAQLIVRPATQLSDINGWTCTDPVGLRNVKTSISDTRAYIKKHCTCQ